MNVTVVATINQGSRASRSCSRVDELGRNEGYDDIGVINRNCSPAEEAPFSNIMIPHLDAGLAIGLLQVFVSLQ